MGITQKIDPETSKALQSFKARLTARYGERLKSVYLFGSRARGDFHAESDADVAVFIDEVTSPMREQLDLGDDTYDIWMKTGIRIEPWVFEYASFADPDKYRAANLVKTIRREGLAA